MLLIILCLFVSQRGLKLLGYRHRFVFGQCADHDVFLLFFCGMVLQSTIRPYLIFFLAQPRLRLEDPCFRQLCSYAEFASLERLARDSIKSGVLTPTGRFRRISGMRLA